MEIVIKKGGKRKEIFNADKIIKSVANAAKDAKLAPAKFLKEIAEPTIKYFQKKKIVKTSDIKKSILRKLAKKSKAVLRAWKMYEKKK